MRWLRILSRIAFVCNIFFIVALLLAIAHWVPNKEMEATDIFIGFVLALIFTSVVNVCYLILFVLRRKFWQVVPSWLITANILFLLIQFLYIVYLNDYKHT
jgi:hypothetical protein